MMPSNENTSAKLSGNVEVFITDLTAKAKHLNIHDINPFFQSALFRNHGLAIDENRGIIIKTFATDGISAAEEEAVNESTYGAMEKIQCPCHYYLSIVYEVWRKRFLMAD